MLIRNLSRPFYILFFAILVLGSSGLRAQYLWNSDSSFKAGVANSGRLWGYSFGDFYYKSHADSLSRGNGNQYSGIPSGRSEFAFRRIYLGYDYNISKKFSVELLLAAEDNFAAGNPPSSGAPSGDLTQSGKLTFYIKLANIRWKNIWKGTDLVVGQVNTPTFATPGMSEPTWSYRAIERTITDIRRTPSFDLGATLQGTFDPANRNYGFDLMVANGSAAKPESDNYKWLYGDLWAKFFDKRVVVQFYADYERLNWLSNWHHSRQMIKGYAAYTTPAFTFGIEAFTNHLQNDNFATKIAGGVDTLSANATGLSIFVHGNIVTNKLRFFARLDTYNPMNIIDNNTYNKYTGNTGNYNDNSYQKAANGTLTATGDQTYKQTFVTAGLDFTPVKGVHFMPNIWYNHHNTQLPGGNADYDLVYRLTFYFVFGK